MTGKLWLILSVTSNKPQTRGPNQSNKFLAFFKKIVDQRTSFKNEFLN
jgi:hypothetical protein